MSPGLKFRSSETPFPPLHHVAMDPLKKREINPLKRMEKTAHKDCNTDNDWRMRMEGLTSISYYGKKNNKQ